VTDAVYTKTYRSTRQAETARAHHDWLSRLEADIRLPQLRSSSGRRLILEYLDGSQPEPADLPSIAAALGRLHTTAHTRHLHTAQLDTPFRATPQLLIVNFVTPRTTHVTEIPNLQSLPAALYKDCNIRNVILTDDGVAIIDFDDLGLAPFGYDLAKLVVSAAMTHGRLPTALIEQAIDAYNTETGIITDAECSTITFQRYANIHHRLTARYIGSHGYVHAWPDVSPWR
jgi:Ser/Thr protein kinase RdoA (MazF antagonist)